MYGAALTKGILETAKFLEPLKWHGCHSEAFDSLVDCQLTPPAYLSSLPHSAEAVDLPRMETIRNWKLLKVPCLPCLKIMAPTIFNISLLEPFKLFEVEKTHGSPSAALFRQSLWPVSCTAQGERFLAILGSRLRLRL